MKFGTAALIASFILPTAFANQYAEKIPDPNVCDRLDSSYTGTWQSYDCPINALCVRSPSGPPHSFCSCSYDEDMLTMNSDRKCIPSSSTKIYSAFQALISASSLAAAIPYFKPLLCNFRSKQKFDFVLLSGILAFISLVLQAIHRALRTALLILTFQGTWTRTLLVNLGVAFLSLSCLTMIATVLVVGVGIHSFVLQTSRLQPLDARKLRKRVIRTAAGCGFILVVGDGILLGMSQYAIAYFFSSFFIFSSWMLYNRVLGHTLSMIALISESEIKPETNNSSTSAFTTSSSAINSHSSSEMTKQALQLIRNLSSRLGVLLLLDTCVCIVYPILWYVGRLKSNRLLLGPCKVAISVFHFYLCLGACFTVCRFVRDFLAMRKHHAIAMIVGNKARGLTAVAGVNQRPSAVGLAGPLTVRDRHSNVSAACNIMLNVPAPNTRPLRLSEASKKSTVAVCQWRESLASNCDGDILVD